MMITSNCGIEIGRISSSSFTHRIHFFTPVLNMYKSSLSDPVSIQGVSHPSLLNAEVKVLTILLTSTFQFRSMHSWIIVNKKVTVTTSITGLQFPNLLQMRRRKRSTTEYLWEVELDLPKSITCFRVSLRTLSECARRSKKPSASSASSNAACRCAGVIPVSCNLPK